MNRTGTRPLGDRTISGLVHTMIDRVGDGSLQQTLNLFGRGKQGLSDIEVLHPFGMRTYPQDKTSDEDAKSGAPKGAPEVSMFSLGGDQSNSTALPPLDRRFGPKGLDKGETVFHDAFKQVLHFAKGVMKGESPNRIVHQVVSPKQQSGRGQSGGSTQDAQQQQQDSGRADLKAEKDVHVSVAMDRDGTYAVTAEGAATITAKSITLKAEGCSITMANGKIILKGEIHLGDDGGQLVHRKGDVDSDNDAAVGSASKVYAV